MPADLPPLNWNDLRYVLAVARAKAIAPAAKAMRVDETTVARRIRRIEQSLRLTLFEPRWRVTEIGAHIVERAARMEEEAIAIAESSAGADSATGSVRITAIPLIASRLLLPAVRRLMDAHPGLSLEVVAEPRNLSVMRRDADIALRHARPVDDQQAITRRIADLDYAVYGPTALDARRLSWVAYEAEMGGLPHAAWINRAVSRERHPARLAVNDSELALNAVKAGIGKSLLPCLIADRESGLRRLGGKAPVLKREVWLLVNPAYKHVARIKAATAWIEGIFSEKQIRRRRNASSQA